MDDIQQGLRKTVGQTPASNTVPNKPLVLESRWWFLSRSGFYAFTRDPIAQAYEIISRHPGFCLLAWAQGNGLSRLPLWPTIEQATKDQFFFMFKGEIHRMNLVRRVFGGEKMVEFDCSESAGAILSSIEYQLRPVKMFHPKAGREDAYLTPRVPPELLKAEFFSGDKAMGRPPSPIVKIRLTLLKRYLSTRTLKRRYGRVGFTFKNLRSAIETFLTKDGAYLAHRAMCLKRFRGRAKMVSPLTTALGCIAWDWKQAGNRLTDLSGWLRTQSFHLFTPDSSTATPKGQRWDNHMAALKRLHSTVMISKTQKVIVSTGISTSEIKAIRKISKAIRRRARRIASS